MASNTQESLPPWLDLKHPGLKHIVKAIGLIWISMPEVYDGALSVNALSFCSLFKWSRDIRVEISTVLCFWYHSSRFFFKLLKAIKETETVASHFSSPSHLCLSHRVKAGVLLRAGLHGHAWQLLKLLCPLSHQFQTKFYPKSWHLQLRELYCSTRV